MSDWHCCPGFCTSGLGPTWCLGTTGKELGSHTSPNLTQAGLSPPHSILEVLWPDLEVGKGVAICLVSDVWNEDDPCGGGVSHAEVSRELENTVSDGWAVLAGGKLTAPRQEGR